MKENSKSSVPAKSRKSLTGVSVVSLFLFVFLIVYIFVRKGMGMEYIPWISYLSLAFLLIGIITLIFRKKK